MATYIEGGEKDLESGAMTPNWIQNPLAEPSPTLSPSTPTAPALVLSNSGKRIDHPGKKKYVKQVTKRHNDTEMHLAAQKGDLAAVRQILDNIDSQMKGTLSGAELDAEVAEIRTSMVNEENKLGETALFIAAEKGHLEVVKELLKYSSEECVLKKNRSGFDPLHIAAVQGDLAIVQVLLDHDPRLSYTIGPSNVTPLISAAIRGHTAVVNELLSKDDNMFKISRSNGQHALHLAARQGHVDIVKALLEKDPQLARRTDKKGQTALHMAVKGQSCEVVQLLLGADAAILMLPDKFGNTALHVATRKKRVAIVNELLSLPDTNVNALTRDHMTALDIAERLPLSEESSEIRDRLSRYVFYFSVRRIKWRLLLFSFIIEGLSSAFDQLTSSHKPIYAFLAMLMASLGFIVSIIELSHRIREGNKIIWRILGDGLENFGFLGSFWQCIYSIISYIYIDKKLNNPIKVSVLPLIFLICVAISGLYGNNRRRTTIGDYIRRHTHRRTLPI